MPIIQWWTNDDREIYWLEVTERDDIGADLRAPQENESGHEYWSYSLVREVADGDIVFHYSKRQHVIGSWSRAEGGSWGDTIYWGARGTVGRANDPYDRPGWVHGLKGPFAVARGVSLADLRRAEPELRVIRDELALEHGDPLYFPFELGDKRALRTAQGYLFKLPAAAVRALPGLSRVQVRDTNAPRTRSMSAAAYGVEYRRLDERVANSARDPFAVDPGVVERGLRGHRRAQNALADHLKSLGLEPRSPRPSEPAFDLAWARGDERWVAEVKSLTKKNEERQLRLGLGQVLRYRYLLAEQGCIARAVLLAEREPSDPSWNAMCESLDVLLAWPDNLRVRIT